jgi:hypothetical protein
MNVWTNHRRTTCPIGAAALILLGLTGCSTPASTPGTDGAATQDALGYDGGGTTPDAGASTPDGGGADGGDDAVPAGPMGARYGCPVALPQRVYGYAINATVSLERDETWTADNVYLVFGPFHTGAHTLTIQPGTVVCFDFGPPGTEGNPEPPPGFLNVDAGGALRVLGTASQHVVFAQLNNPDQYWGGIALASGFAGTTTMQFLDVYNAGISSAGPALSTFPDQTAPRLDLQHVTFHSLQRNGLSILTAGLTPESRVVVSEYAAETPATDLAGYHVLAMHPFGAGTLDDQMFTVGPAVPRVVRHVQFDYAGASSLGSVHLHRLQDGLAYRATAGMLIAGPVNGPPSVLTLDPGVRILAHGAAPITIGDGQSRGDLVAVGTEAQPIVFTSDQETPAPGDWNSVEFNPGSYDTDITRIEYVRFEYGGGAGLDEIYSCQDSQRGNGLVGFNTSIVGGDFDGVSIRHTTFANSAGNAVRGYCNGVGLNCLRTDYQDPALGNVFLGFDTDRPAQLPLGCP